MQQFKKIVLSYFGNIEFNSIEQFQKFLIENHLEEKETLLETIEAAVSNNSNYSFVSLVTDDTDYCKYRKSILEHLNLRLSFLERNKSKMDFESEIKVDFFTHKILNLEKTHKLINGKLVLNKIDKEAFKRLFMFFIRERMNHTLEKTTDIFNIPRYHTYLSLKDIMLEIITNIIQENEEELYDFNKDLIGILPIGVNIYYIYSNLLKTLCV